MTTIILLATVVRLTSLHCGAPVQEIFSLKGKSTIRSISFSADSSIMAFAAGQETFRLIDVRKGLEYEDILFQDRGSSLISVAFSSDSKALATFSGKCIRLWDYHLGKETGKLDGAGGLLFFSKDAEWLGTYANPTHVSLFETKTLREKHRIGPHPTLLSAVALAPDKSVLATYASSKEIRLWDVANNRVRHVLRGHKDGTNALIFSHDGKTLFSGGMDFRVALWDTATGNERASLDLKKYRMRVEALAIAPGGKTLAIAGFGPLIVFWDLDANKELAVLKTDRTFCLEFSPDGKWLATGTGGFVKLWSVAEILAGPRPNLDFLNEFRKYGRPGLFRDLPR